MIQLCASLINSRYFSTDPSETEEELEIRIILEDHEHGE